MQPEIHKNKAKCLSCNNTVESNHRHDYVSCPCGNMAVDGGKDYLRRTAMDMSKVEELSTMLVDGKEVPYNYN